MTISLSGNLITLSHCPLKGVFREDTSDMNKHRPGDEFYGALWHGETMPKKQKFTVINNGQYHIHGHCHKKEKKLGSVFTDQQFDVGVCGNNYKPYKEKELISWISKMENKK